MANLTPELARMRDETRELAARYGLDFYDVIFELVDADELNMIAAYGGFPVRYPHWRFGMEFEQLQKGYTWGLSKIYELVINNDPCYAYLMRSNSLTDQKLVMAHVYGHCDFFKNNLWFSKTPRKMMDVMANHGARIRRYMDRHGVERVENFVDLVHSLDNLIDIHSPFIQREQKPRARPVEDEIPDKEPRLFKIAAKDYMDRYINPPEFLARQREQAVQDQTREEKFPPRPARDVLKFLLDHAPLQVWEQDVLAMLREEAYYFAPQGMTKIMNEGWASFWHSLLMTRHLVEASEIVNYADAHSGTMFTQPGQINPYKIGIELWRHVEERWDKGRFGKDWDDCDDVEVRRNWDRGAGLGRDKIFEVRRIFNDVSFIDEFVDAEFADRQRLFVFGFNPSTGRYEIADRDWHKVKDGLLNALTNFGQPRIDVADANYRNRGELYLLHDWHGADLQFDEAMKTLENVFSLWRRPVHLETREGGKGRLMSYDGSSATIKETAGSKTPAPKVGTGGESS